MSMTLAWQACENPTFDTAWRLGFTHTIDDTQRRPEYHFHLLGTRLNTNIFMKRCIVEAAEDMKSE